MPDQNYVPFGPQPVFMPDEPISEMTPSFGAYFEAAAGNGLRDAREEECRRLADAKAGAETVWVPADIYIPSDIREFAQRYKIPVRGLFPCAQAFAIGWRAAIRAKGG